MINYELAKELKTAGFKSEHQMDMDTGSWCVNCPYDKSNNKGFEDMCFPTLSELIEACEPIGNLFTLSFLEGNGGSGLDDNGNSISDEWEAEQGGFLGVGSTPEEAVSRLWLELNKK